MVPHSMDLSPGHYCHPRGYLQICWVLGGETSFFNNYLNNFFCVVVVVRLYFSEQFLVPSKIGWKVQRAPFCLPAPQPPRSMEEPEAAFEHPGPVRPHILPSPEQLCPQRTCLTPAPAANMLGPLLDVGIALRVSGSGK